MPGRDQSFYTSTLKRTTAPQIDSTSTNIHFEPLEPRLLLSASDIDPNLVESISASAQQVVAPADAADSINQQQTQYDNFFWPNTISFDFAIDPDAIDGLIDITALSDLNGTGETVAYDIEGIVAGTLFTAEDDGLRPFTASIQISDADLATIAADGNLHIEFTPSSNVDDYYDVQEYVTVALSYQVIQTGSISGLVWADINADGTHDPDEPGQAGVTVFLDTNQNGQLDWTDTDADQLWSPGEGEQWIATDETGQYVFNELPPGDYPVVIEPASWQKLTTYANNAWSDMPILVDAISGPDIYPYTSFGNRVADSGERLLVIATLPPVEGYLGGGYIYHKTSEGYRLEGVVQIPEGIGVDRLNLSEVAITDDWVAISGWTLNDDYEGPAITMFHRTGSTWSLHSVVYAPGTDTIDPPYFYQSALIAMAGSTMTVTSLRTQQAWVFEYQDGIWTDVADITPDDITRINAYPYPDDAFGHDVVMDENTIVIGAPGQYDEPTQGYGALYIYERVDGVWTQTAKFTNTDGSKVRLGTTLDLSGDLLISGAPNRTGIVSTGYVYIYRNTPDQGWQLEQRIIGDDIGYGNYFGATVAIVGNVIAAQARSYGTDTSNNAVYLFEYDGTTWIQTNKLHADTLGTSTGTVYAVGDTLILPDTGYDIESSNEGRVFFYQPDNATYQTTVSLSEGQLYNLDDVGVTHIAPSITLLADSDTGISNSDRNTSLNNHDGGSLLTFFVSGVESGSLVTLFDNDGDSIGSAQATGNSLYITTDGQTTLADGLQWIELSITSPAGDTWNTRQWIDVVIDTVAPVAQVDPQSTVSLLPSLTGYVNEPDAQVSVFIGLDVFNVEPDETGQWSISQGDIPALDIGTYNVVIYTADAAGNFSVTEFQDALTTTAPSEISGVVWRDINGNGIQDVNEPGQAQVAVYLDLNADGRWNADEPRQLTSEDITDTPEDEVGHYHFTGLPEGDYFVRIDTTGTDYHISIPGSIEQQWNSIEYAYSINAPKIGSLQTIGTTVDVSEHVMVVSSYAYTSGIRYYDATIFTRDGYGSPWEFAKYINENVLGTTRQSSTYRVATNDEFVFVGLPGESTVYIFKQDPDSGQWVQTGTLLGADFGLDWFSGNMTVDGNTLVVSGFNTAASQRFVLTFERDPGSLIGWTHTNTFAFSATPGTSAAYDTYVAIQDDLLVVGDQLSSKFGERLGAVSIYQRDSADPQQWNLVQDLDPTGITTHSKFGYLVGITGNTIVVGNSYEVFIYEPDQATPGQWTLVATPDVSDLRSSIGFFVETDTILISSPSGSLLLERNISSEALWQVVPTAFVYPRAYRAIDGEYLIYADAALDSTAIGTIDYYRFTGNNPWYYLYVAPDEVITNTSFGVSIPSSPPATPQLQTTSDTGISDTDLITRYNNSSSETVLAFDVPDIPAGSVVFIYDNDIILGKAVSYGEPLTTVYTAGVNTLADGTHSITAARQDPGMDISLHSEPVLITIDTTAPRIVGSSIQQNQTLPTGSNSLVLTFDEDIDPTFLWGGANYKNLLTGSLTTFNTDDYTYDPTSFTLSFDLNLKDEGPYQFTTGNTIKDLAGNLLDGEPPLGTLPPEVSGDGTPGGAFTFTFDADIQGDQYPASAFTNVTVIDTLGETAELIHRYINNAQDTDRFHIGPALGQLITVIVEPVGDSDSILTLELPDETIVASGPGESIVWTFRNDIPDYQLYMNVGAYSATEYNMTVHLNAVPEHILPNISASGVPIYDLTDIWTELNDGTASFASVLGQSLPLSGILPATYTVDLVAGQTFSVLLDTDSDELSFELLDAQTHDILAQSTTNAYPNLQSIEFTAPSTSTYYVQINATANAPYVLSLLRDALFDQQLNYLQTVDEPSQSLDTTGQVLGHIDATRTNRLFALGETSTSKRGTTVYELNPTTLDPIREFTLEGLYRVSDLAYDGVNLYARTVQFGPIWALDPETGAVRHKIDHVGISLFSDLAYYDSLLVMQSGVFGNELTFFDPFDGSIVETLTTDIDPDARLTGLVGVESLGSLFATYTKTDVENQLRTWLVEIDRATGEVINGSFIAPSGVSSLAYANNRIYTYDYGNGELRIIDPATHAQYNVQELNNEDYISIAGDGILYDPRADQRADQYTIDLMPGQQFKFLCIKTGYSSVNNLHLTWRVTDPSGEGVPIKQRYDGLTYIAPRAGTYTIEVFGWSGSGDYLLAVTPAPYLAGDLNYDGFVGLADIDILLNHWNQNVAVGNLAYGDASGDGFVGLDDLDIILGNWNAGTPPETTTVVQSVSASVEEDTAMMNADAELQTVQRKRDIPQQAQQRTSIQSQTQSNNQLALRLNQKQQVSLRDDLDYIPTALQQEDDSLVLGLWE